MKKLIALAFALISFGAASAAPDKIPVLTGKLVEAYAFTQIDFAQVTCFEVPFDGTEQKELYSFVVYVNGCESISDLSERLSSQSVTLNLQDPRSEIRVEAVLNSSQQTVFIATSQFGLQKEYDDDGKAFWTTPWWATQLQFSFVGIEVPLRDVTGASLVRKDGSTVELNSSRTGIYLTQQDVNDLQAGNMEITFRDGTIGQYDFSGHQLKPSNSQVRFGEPFGVYFDGISQIEPYEGAIDVQFGPEWGYNPAIETKIAFNGKLKFTGSSYNGFQPKYIHVTTYNELSQKEAPQVVEYYEGMEIEGSPNQIILIWMEFDSSVIDSFNEDGPKG